MLRTTFTCNLDIVRAKGFIPYWEIGKKLGVHENTLRNWMRRELDPKKKAKILNAIEQIKQEELLEEK